MNIVLVEPEIPPNTGNVARLCAATPCSPTDSSTCSAAPSPTSGVQAWLPASSTEASFRKRAPSSTRAAFTSVVTSREHTTSPRTFGLSSAFVTFASIDPKQIIDYNCITKTNVTT